MRGRQAKEAGEPQGLDRRVDGFQRPPENLRPHIDTKRGLYRGPSSCGRRALRCKRLSQPPLRRAFQGLLQDCVHHMVGSRFDGQGMPGDDRLPAGTDLVLVAIEQSLFPDQADRQEIGDGRIRGTTKLGLPALVARILRPAETWVAKPDRPTISGVRSCVAAARQAA